MPRLRVLAGPSLHALAPITSLVNTNTPHEIKSDKFHGEVVVFIKAFNQADPSIHSAEEDEYFGRADRNGVTWSIQVQGRFLSPHSADEILFGNVFSRPFVSLPWGTTAALKFMKFIDPTLSHDLTCTATQKPWALSPLVATMPHLMHIRLESPDAEVDSNTATAPRFPPAASISDDTSSLHLCLVAPELEAPRASTPSSSGSSSSRSGRSSISSERSRDSKKGKSRRTSNGVPCAMTSQQRRSYFSNEARRKAVVFGPQDVITTDFCYGFLQFAPSLRLRLPGGLGIDLARYWDGQPVRFVCCERKQPQDEASENDDPWGPIFWCVSIELDSEDGEDN